MALPLVDVLCRRAVTLPDPAARVQLFRSLVATVPDAVVRDVMEVLIVRAGLRDTAAQVALLALQAVLSSRPQAPRHEHDGAHAANSPNASGATGTGDPDGREPTVNLPPSDRVPDYGKGRTLTLGERKSLARRPDRRLLDRVLRDPHPDVIALLLQNPRLTEADVVRLCAFRPGDPEILARVSGNPKWAARAAVRRALSLNPATPEEIAGALVALLPPEDLRTIAMDPRVPASVRRRCFEILARLVPMPGGALGGVH